MTEVAKKLPTLKDLVSKKTAKELLQRDQLNFLLNQKTPHQWVKKHPTITIKVGEKNGQDIKEALQYVPVEKVKMILTQIFGGYKNRITGVYQMFNSVCVTVELSVIDPLTGNEIIHDGIGAVGVQTDKGASASNLGAIKYDAVQKAAPAAESYALKNAAEKLGAIFGGALQKYDLTAFSPVYDEQLKKDIANSLQAQYAAQNGQNNG